MVKKGYKQTEVGVIPEKWIVSTIGSIADVKTGPFGSALHAEDYVQDGTPIITVEHLGETGLTRQNLPKVSEEDRHRLSAYSMQEGDIVFSRVGSVDRNAYVTASENGWLFSGRILRIRAKSEELSTQYLGYYFKSEDAKERIRNVAVGQTMASLNTKLMNAFKVVLPTVEEQKNIAALLSNMDTLISTLEKQVSKKKAIKQGAMQELLTGKRRLPGFSGNWQTISLKKALSVGHGMSQHDVECPTGRYPILATGGVIGRANRYLWNAPSVLIGRKGTINKPQYMDKPFWSIDTLFYTKINEGYCPKFLYYVFCRIDWLSYNEASGVPSLSSKTIESIEVQVPDYREQCAIAGALTDIDTEIEALEQKSGKYRQVKQGMMQQLLTGKIRLM